MKGKTYSEEFKNQILNEVKEVGNISLVGRKYGEVTQENDKLKKILGEKDLEIAILRDLLKKANPQLKIK